MKPDAIWTLPAVGVVTLSNTGNRREPLFAEGYRRMEVLLAQGNQIHQTNIDELKSIGPGLIAAGWKICSWHSTTGVPTPEEEAETALAAISQVKGFISGHNLNAEQWYEGANAWKTKAYWDRFQNGSSLPLAVWPEGSDTGSAKRPFDYQTCIERGCMVFPQQYQNKNPSYTIGNGDANLEFAGVPAENRGTSPGTFVNAQAPTIPWDSYAHDLQILRRPPLLFYCDAGGFDPIAAGKLVFPPAPEPEPDMEMIGSQHGVKAWYNRMKASDPAGCNPAFNPDDYNAISPDKLKVYDKMCRTLLILVNDHDELVSKQ